MDLRLKSEQIVPFLYFLLKYYFFKDYKSTKVKLEDFVLFLYV